MIKETMINIASNLYGEIKELPLKATSYVLKDGGRRYECSDDVAAELKQYNDLTFVFQGDIDRVKSRSGEDVAQEYFDKAVTHDPSTNGGAWQAARNCLESLGYPLDKLDPIIVPEFGEIAPLILAGSIFGSLFAMRYFGKLSFNGFGNQIR